MNPPVPAVTLAWAPSQAKALRATMVHRPHGCPMDEIKREYMESYEAWQRQLQALHSVLLQGERMDPPKLKGLLNREARAKERYDQARRRLLGLSGEE